MGVTSFSCRKSGARVVFSALLVFLVAVNLFTLALAEAESISVSGAKNQPVKLIENRTPLPGPSVKPDPVAISKPVKSGSGVAVQAVSTRREKESVPDGFMTLNFEAAPIREVIKNICEISKMNYIVEEGVKGFVTIRTLNKISISYSLELLDQLLLINGLTRVKVGKYWRFLPAAKAIKEPMPIYRDKPATSFSAHDRFQIQILTFNYVSAAQVADIIKPFLSQNATATILERSNMMILVERGVKLYEILNLVKALDIDSLDTMQVKLFELENSLAADVNAELISIYTAMGYLGGKKGGGMNFIPLERINGILMINPFPNLLPSVNAWIARLDAPPEATEELSTFIYKVQAGEASNIAQILGQLYSLPQQTESGASEADMRQITATSMGPIQIIAHPQTNSIIIRTSGRDYPKILETLKKLDQMPMQVLIEVLITDLTLTDNLEYGLEWAMRSAEGRNYGALNSGNLGAGGAVAGNLDGLTYNPVGTAGFSYFTRRTPNVMAFLHALASESKLEVRASPVLMTSDNQQASIDITNEVPISTTSESQGGTITQNIQYRSVGTRLSVTPKINDERFVTLTVDQEISQIDDSRFSGDLEKPIPLLRRQAKTTVVVKDQETLIIGGMINKQKGAGSSGVPFLSKIPIVGWFFGSKTKTDAKTEVLIFITPHVITSEEEGRAITEQFRDKIKEIQDTAKAGKHKSLQDSGKASGNPAPKKGASEKKVM